MNLTEMITTALEEVNETWDDVVSHTLTTDELEKVFYDGYGVPECTAFTLWTKERVYFPCTYDGGEWVASVPRNPESEEATEHIGGW